MEIYSFYQAALITASLITQESKMMFLIATVVGLLMWAAVFVLQGVGIYTMAKKQGLKKRALAFVPFANILYLGKLAGECNFFGQRMKRAGMYAMIAQIVATAMCIITIVSEQYLWLAHGEPQIETTYGTYYWTGLTGFSLTVSKFYDISGYLLPIFQMFVEIFLVVLMMGLCKKYAPKNYMLLSILTLFVPISRFIIIFALRNRRPIDYDAYMRARREEYMRRQQQYHNQQNPYGNSYGNPYNNPYNNPYGNPYGNQHNPYGNQHNPYGQNPNTGSGTPADEPFAEFSSDKGAGANTASDAGEDSDGLFS